MPPLREGFDWSQATLDQALALLDSNRVDVQTFAINLVREHGAAFDGAELAVRLAQHPHPNMRRFALECLERFLPDGAESLERLEMFFRACLFDAWPQTAVKQRAVRILCERGSRDAAQAGLAINILEDLVRVSCRRDFEGALAALTRLRLAWPGGAFSRRAVRESCGGGVIMIVATRYQGRSGVVAGVRQTHVALATNTLREATFFEGELSHPLPLREAMAALHQVVVSDAKYRPRDRTEFMAWVADQDRKFLATLGARSAAARQRLAELFARREALDAEDRLRLAPFHKARRAFFEHVWRNEYELRLLLDPVITVHPDEVAFEAFLPRRKRLRPRGRQP
jgi:hypothetical protein